MPAITAALVELEALALVVMELLPITMVLTEQTGEAVAAAAQGGLVLVRQKQEATAVQA